MTWYQVSVQCTQEHAQAIAQRMEEHGAAAVSFVDAADDPVLEPPLGEAIMWGCTQVQGLFGCGGPALHHVTVDLAAATGSTPKVASLADRDWVRDTQARPDPTEFGNGLWIVPYDHRSPAGARATVELEPGIAFGTGSHPTTRLCLEWLSLQDHLGPMLLDYGCGSGILAIAGLKLGAARALLVDMDPQALESAMRNATHNAVDTVVETTLSGALDAALVRHPAVDTLVANILLEPLVNAAPMLLDRLPQGARVCLSGILSNQADTLINAYRHALDNVEQHHAEGWARVCGVRNRR